MRNRVVFGLTLAVAVPALAFAQANVAGKWTGEVQGGRGPTPVTLELTVTGTAVAGKLTQGQGMPVDIQNAKLEGNKLTFSAPGGAVVVVAVVAVAAVVPQPVGLLLLAAPPAGAPPAGAPPAGGPPAGAGGGGGGGGAVVAVAVVELSSTTPRQLPAADMSVTREPAAPAGGAPAAGAPPAGAPPRLALLRLVAAVAAVAAAPVTFTLKKA